MTFSIETYERIARAVAFVQQHHLEQPDLKTIAQHVHLSESQFQRLFTQWAGISPQRFLEFLTVEYAKSKIVETANLFDSLAGVGLSSPEGAGDCAVTLEAMSPGESKSGGRNLEITYGIHSTPFGQCLIATTPRGICNLHFLDATPTAETVLRSQWSNAELFQNQSVTEEIRDRIFSPILDKPLVLFVKGTNFQLQVWRALLSIPPGGITTYQGLATQIGRPTAARAVGTAIASNPVGYLIPCHRVIRESGTLGGFRWGLERKSLLLGWEAIALTLNQREIPKY